MRKILGTLAVLTLLLTACGEEATVEPGGSGSPSVEACSKDSLNLVNAGQLTVATDSPVYPPWFIKNDPSNGKGYEGALTYAIAEQLGFSAAEVTWIVVPFNKSYAPGPKDFDFDINEISITPERAQVVTFSDGYYDVTQALVAVEGNPITKATTIPELRSYKLGSTIGSTSLAYIAQYIDPTQQFAVYDTVNDAISALQVGQIDGLVLDLPTAYYSSSAQVKNGVLVGQFPPAGEQYGLLFEQDNPLVTCVNEALATLQSDGTVQSLQDEYLADYQAVPVIQP